MSLLSDTVDRKRLRRHVAPGTPPRRRFAGVFQTRYEYLNACAYYVNHTSCPEGGVGVGAFTPPAPLPSEELHGTV